MNGSIELEAIVNDMKEEQKFCIKCTHLLGNRSYPENWEGWKCSKTKQEAGINLVNGDMIFVDAYCDKVRQNQESCGPEGKWYEEYKRPNLLVPETPYIYPKKPKGKI